MNRESREQPIPLIDLAAQHRAIRGELDDAIDRVLSSNRFVLGPEVEGFERELAAYCEVSCAVSCASGSDALLLSLMALGVGPDDEVICPAYSFFATASSVSRLGARPVFADIDPSTYNLSPSAVRDAAAGCSRLRAIMPVDLFGQACDVQAFLELSHELGVPLVEDAAQAVGARDAQGQIAGSRAAVGCFSLYPPKNLGALGDGGAILTCDAELAEQIATLRVHGAREQRYTHDVIGINSRLDALQAAMLRVKLRHLESWTKRRRENAAYLDARLLAGGAASTKLRTRDADLPLCIPHAPPAGGRHVYHQYVVRVPAEHRDDLRQELRRNGIGSAIYYPLGLHEQPCFAALGYRRGDLPHTEAAAGESLALPIHPELSTDRLDAIAETTVGFLRSRRLSAAAPC